MEGQRAAVDGGRTWKELPALRQHATAPKWAPGAGGMCLHAIVLDRKIPGRMFVAISAAGVFRSDDSGASWRPMNKGLHSDYIPDKKAEVGCCVHKIVQHPAKPETLYMQLHGGVLKSENGGELWKDINRGPVQRAAGRALAARRRRGRRAFPRRRLDRRGLS